MQVEKPSLPMLLSEGLQGPRWDHGTGEGREPLTASSTDIYQAWVTPASKTKPVYAFSQ